MPWTEPEIDHLWSSLVKLIYFNILCSVVPQVCTLVWDHQGGQIFKTAFDVKNAILWGHIVSNPYSDQGSLIHNRMPSLWPSYWMPHMGDMIICYNLLGIWGPIDGIENDEWQWKEHTGSLVNATDCIDSLRIGSPHHQLLVFGASLEALQQLIQWMVPLRTGTGLLGRFLLDLRGIAVIKNGPKVVAVHFGDGLAVWVAITDGVSIWLILIVMVEVRLMYRYRHAMFVACRVSDSLETATITQNHPLYSVNKSVRNHALWQSGE